MESVRQALLLKAIYKPVKAFGSLKAKLRVTKSPEQLPVQQI